MPLTITTFIKVLIILAMPLSKHATRHPVLFNLTDLLHPSVNQYVTNPTVDSNWAPIPALLKTTGDLTMIFISFNALRFEQPSYDPVFRATEELGDTTRQGEAVHWWDPNYYVSVVGCVDQHAMCNPDRGGICTPLGGSSDFLNASQNAQYGFTPNQQAVVLRIANQAVFTSIFQALTGRGASALRAQETVNGLDQFPLSDTHWMVEVTSWFTTGLAHLQRGVLEYAQGPLNVGEGTYIWQPGDPFSRHMCRNQLVRSTEGTISFSLLGVGIILALGGFTVLLSFVLEPVVGLIQQKWRRGDYRRVSWTVDDKLQLQRALYQERGWGAWEDGHWGVPVCGKGETFGGQESAELVDGATEQDGRLPEEEGLMRPLQKVESQIQVTENRVVSR